jgi:exonuclease SbcC
MARYFLEGLEGFLVMDDPLVDMDPERQEAAAKVIQNFASEKQILIATCHPTHADLLGGHMVLL